MSIELFTPKQVSEILKVSEITLAKWRSNKTGPEYVKIGRLVKYRPESIEAYLKQHTVVNNG